MRPIVFSTLRYQLQRFFPLLTYVTHRIVLQDKAREVHNDRSEGQETKGNSSDIDSVLDVSRNISILLLERDRTGLERHLRIMNNEMTIERGSSASLQT